MVIDILSSQEEEPADGHPAGPCPPEPKTIATAMDVSSEEEGAGAVNDPEVKLNTGKDERTKEDLAAAEKPTTEKKDADKHDPDSDSSSESNSESEAPPSSKHGLAEESDEPASPAPTPKAAPRRRAARAKASPKAKAKGKAKASPKAKAKRGPRACRPKASPKPKPATACKSKAKAKEVAEKLSAELQESGSGKKIRKRKNADE